MADDVAGLQPVDGRRPEVDAADDDLARLLAGLLQHLAHLPVMPPCCVPIAFRFGMALDVGDEHRHGERGVAVHVLRDLQPVDLQAGLLERVGEAFFGLAALGLAEHAVDHRLVARLQALGKHRLRR